MAVSVVGTTVRATAYDTLYNCQTAAGVCGVVLPAVTLVQDGFTVQVVDAGNNAGVNNIVISTADGTLINGNSSLVVNNNSAAVSLVKIGQTWSASGSFETIAVSPNITPLWVTQTVTTATAAILPTTTLVLCNFAGSVSLTLPATSNPSVVFGRPIFVQNQTNTGNTSTNCITVTGNTSASLNAVSNGVLTISAAFGGLRLVPSSVGFWSF
jgi:hypothetical protein